MLASHKFLIVRKALNGVLCSLKFFSYIRLRVFAGVFLRIVAGYRLGFRQQIARKNSN